MNSDYLSPPRPYHRRREGVKIIVRQLRGPLSATVRLATLIFCIRATPLTSANVLQHWRRSPPPTTGAQSNKDEEEGSVGGVQRALRAYWGRRVDEGGWWAFLSRGC